MKDKSSQSWLKQALHILSLIFPALLTLSSASLSIADNQTGLEYLIFRLEPLPNESPTPEDSHNKLLALREILGSTAPTGQGHSLVGEDSALTLAKNRLNQNSRYRVLLHAQVRRPEEGDFGPVRFRIKRGSATSDVRVYFQLRGANTLRLSTSIVYAPADSLSNVENETAGDRLQSSWVIRDTRKIKVGETNYIDHPRFGVLVVATHPD
jgi:hypothetical protein